jgi:hypothetical protein
MNDRQLKDLVSRECVEERHLADVILRDTLQDSMPPGITPQKFTTSYAAFAKDNPTPGWLVGGYGAARGRIYRRS